MVQDTYHGLVLGWKVTKQLEPAYWTASTARAGRQLASDLVTVNAPLVANHTIILAQAGSGRMNLVGRLIEEIVIRTKSNVLIIDNNSEFRHIAHSVAPARWSRAGFDRRSRRGFLPDETTQNAFQQKWRKVTTVAHTARGADGLASLRPNWCDLPIEWIFDGVGPILQNQLRCCHGIMQIAIELTAQLTPVPRRSDTEFLRFMKDLVAELVVRKNNRDSAASKFSESFPAISTDSGAYQILVQRVVTYSEFVTEEAERFYFNVANGIQEKAWATFQMTPLEVLPDKRVEVFDIPSIGDTTLRAIVSHLAIKRAWEAARKSWEIALVTEPHEDYRVPTFIVVDDAQHYTEPGPKGTYDSRSWELLREIATQGRKFGVFLILVSPRPDALDPVLAGECDNRAIMRIGSPKVLRRVADLLGLNTEEMAMADRCAEFGPGLALLFGSWMNWGPTYMYCAPRRTLEGGRGLQPGHWARP